MNPKQIPQTEVTASYRGEEIFRAVLPPGEYVLGRATEASIPLRSQNVSRRHAVLTLNYRDWMIEDLNSSNGTKVGGKRIREVTLLFPNQEICVGDVQVELRRMVTGPDDDVPDLHKAALLRFLPRDLQGENKYRIRGLIGMGGMGAVLEAEELATRRVVAMKIMLNTGNAETVARFVAEAQITAQMSHPNILPIYDLSVNAQEKPFYTMKLVRGETLTRALEGIRDGKDEAGMRYSFVELMKIFSKICDAVAYAHLKGVMHRDLKPDNILLGRRGEVWVTDWGLAKPVHRVPADADADASVIITSLRHTDPDAVRTESGVAVGSARYMSPEQAAGSDAVDQRTDVYSLGAILYQMIALEAPVTGDDQWEVMAKVIRGDIPPLATRMRDKPLPSSMDARSLERISEIVRKAMSKSPGNRYTSVRDLSAPISAEASLS